MSIEKFFSIEIVQKLDAARFALKEFIENLREEDSYDAIELSLLLRKIDFTSETIDLMKLQIHRLRCVMNGKKKYDEKEMLEFFDRL